MRLLLDTHVLVWLRRNGPISLTARARLAEATHLFASVVSGWEYEIKRSKGHPDFSEPFAELLNGSTIEPLPLAMNVLPAYADLPSIHRDPFDRMLVAQAISDGLTLVTSDSQVRCYPVETLW